MTHAAHSVSERLLNVTYEKMAMSAHCAITGRYVLVTGGRGVSPVQHSHGRAG